MSCRISHYFDAPAAEDSLLELERTRPIHCQRVMVESSQDKYHVPLVFYSPAADTNYTNYTNYPRRTLLLGYGAYGVCVPTQYDCQVSTYLRRGWVVAFAGTRGGGELGKLHHHR